MRKIRLFRKDIVTIDVCSGNKERNSERIAIVKKENLDSIIPNGFSEAPSMTLLPTQCLVTAEPSYNRYLCEKSTIIDAGDRNHNKSLAMSQLGTVYATKRRRRNGKR